jgi:hypothetical protein
MILEKIMTVIVKIKEDGIYNNHPHGMIVTIRNLNLPVG